MTDFPYPGLRAFTLQDSHLFFGRRRSVDDLIEVLAEKRFLAVLGASGSGKSSLVHTGLLNALLLGYFSSAGSTWLVAECRPGDHPLAELAAALAKKAPRNYPAPDAEALSLSTRALRKWCAGGALEPKQKLLLIVDQFEELFRFASYARREEAEAFVALLVESAEAQDIPIYVVLTMRSEFLGECSLIPGLAEKLNGGFYLTPRMTREECREAIEGPAKVAGFGIDPTLVNQLLNDLASFASWTPDLAGSNQRQLLSQQADQLPLLQHLLNRLWLLARERTTSPEDRVTLTRELYREVGGLEQALEEHGKQVLSGLSVAETKVAELVFRGLVQGTRTVDAVRRPRKLSDLIAEGSGDEAAVMKVVEAFRGHGCNFLKPEHHVALAPDTVIDINHESLIRQWNKLSTWLEREAQAQEKWRELVGAVVHDRQPSDEEITSLRSGLTGSSPRQSGLRITAATSKGRRSF